jgi:hypothetical protein
VFLGGGDHNCFPIPSLDECTSYVCNEVGVLKLGLPTYVWTYTSVGGEFSIHFFLVSDANDMKLAIGSL